MRINDWSADVCSSVLDGTALEAVGVLPDQAIGTRNTKAVAGNHVMLDLGHREYAMLAHLRRGRVAVEAGQQVAAGDELGRCGNRGHTSEPHLLLHLQAAPKFGAGYPNSVVSGKSVSVRLELDGRSYITKQNSKSQIYAHYIP